MKTKMEGGKKATAKWRKYNKFLKLTEIFDSNWKEGWQQMKLMKKIKTRFLKFK